MLSETFHNTNTTKQDITTCSDASTPVSFHQKPAYVSVHVKQARPEPTGFLRWEDKMRPATTLAQETNRLFFFLLGNKVHRQHRGMLGGPMPQIRYVPCTRQPTAWKTWMWWSFHHSHLNALRDKILVAALPPRGGPGSRSQVSAFPR